MKKNIIYLTIGLFSVFIFTLFYVGLQKQSTYVPNQNNKKIIEFSSKDLFSGLKIDSKDIISKNKNIYDKLLELEKKNRCHIVSDPLRKFPYLYASISNFLVITVYLTVSYTNLTIPTTDLVHH